MEKTLGAIARQAWLAPTSLDDWQAVADAVVQAHEARRWRSIDSAPKDQTIDAWSEANGRTPDAEWLERYGWCYHGFDDMEVYGYHRIIPQPTHWTPIPAPPKEASDAE